MDYEEIKAVLNVLILTFVRLPLWLQEEFLTRVLEEREAGWPSREAALEAELRAMIEKGEK